MKILRAVIWVCLVLGCAATLSAQADTFSYDTGADGDDAFSPGWVPDAGGGRWNTGWVQEFGVCTYYPVPTGGRNVGLAMRQYSGCGFPDYNTMRMDIDTDIPYRPFTIKGTSINHNFLAPFSPFTYYFWAESNCRYRDPRTTWNADIVVIEEIHNGC